MISAIDPYCQGDLDSLCGVYAIINALSALCPELNEDIAEVLFTHLVRQMDKVLPGPMPPLSYGIAPDGLDRLLEQAIRFMRKNLEIRLEVSPLETRPGRLELARVWRDLGKRLDGEHVAIL